MNVAQHSHPKIQPIGALHCFSTLPAFDPEQRHQMAALVKIGLSQERLADLLYLHFIITCEF